MDTNGNLKVLLLKDLCCRLPYGVICNDSRHGDSRITDIDIVDEIVYCDDFDEYVKLDKCKPYLRPMSSMTEQELHELAYKVLQQPDLDLVKNTETLDIRFSDLDTLTTWLNAHHLDYHGLIEKGLALKATEGLYNIKD